MLQSFPSVFETAGSCPPMCGRIQDAYSGNRTVLCPVRHHCSTCSSGPLFRRSHSAWQIDPGPYPCHVGCSRFGRAKLSQTETQYLEACVRAAGKWQQSGNKSGTMVPLLFPLMRNSGRSGNKAETKAATRFQFICLHFLGGGRLVRHTTQVEIECVRR